MPVLPTPPLPPQSPLDWAQPSGTSESTAARTWQPLLPGALRYLIVGARSGVMLAVRNQLIRQRDGALVSGSLPVQHRAPRPVPLPPNRPEAREVALRTWAGYFEPERNVLAALGAGAEVLVQARVEPAGAFRQTLTFALRLADPDTTPLPLDPYTIHFEDPEYNRALATQAGLAQRLIKLIKGGNPGEFGLFTATLATERRAYNQYSPLALRYDWDSPELAGTRLRVVFQRVTANGVTEDLVAVGASAAGISQLLPGELLQISLVELRVSQQAGAVGNRFALQPDDKLRIKLLPGADEAGWVPYKRPLLAPEPELIAQIEVDIVDEPVIPAPEAAYALLRSQALGGQAQVECARFAWGPNASRIELVSKDDLKAGVVRRRAVFQWRDIARAGTPEGYAVQKITPNGATHIPLGWEKPGI